ncbi:MAG TPA: ClpXP protease specificity-enhancing factor SspB [Xanthobacteraceae bacterium]|nr:ClpXP protease specificity-enhancing factor SspB [Xanthobacteraceae bacterium]
MAVDHIRYDIRAQHALRGLLRDVLAETAKKGLPGEHHFYISFDTRADGVRLSPRLREQYPEEMTIVLQHQFWDLKVTDDGFEVGLSFGGVPERLAVPFAAVKSFVDPSVQFALQFEQLLAAPPAATPAKPKPAAKSEKLREKHGPPADQVTGTAHADKGKTRRSASPPAPRTVPAIPPAPPLPASPQSSLSTAKPAASDDKPDKPSGGAKVVPLDRFRKK